MKPSPVSNRTLTLLRKLNRKKYRQQEQLFLLEGERAVRQVLDNKVPRIKTLFFDEEQQYWHQALWEKAAESTESFLIPHTGFLEITDTEKPQGVLALCRIPAESPVDRLTSGEGLVIAMDGIQDPGNAGTIIRTSAWFGISGLLSGKGTVDLFHPKVVRSTAGATGSIPYASGDLNEMLEEFEQAGWNVFLLDAGEDAISLEEAEPAEKAVIVVGNEARGLSPEVDTGDRTKVKIPSPAGTGEVESLNAAIAAAIALYGLSHKL